MTIWQDPRVAYLKELLAEGLFAEDIACRLSERYEITVTRNAVLGKCHRLGLHGAHGGPRPNSGRKPTKSRQTPFQTPAPLPPLAAPVNPEPSHEVYGPFRPVTIMDLTNETCRWIVSDVWPVEYCGRPEADLADGMPYCREHARIAYDRRGDRRPNPVKGQPYGVAEPSRPA